MASDVVFQYNIWIKSTVNGKISGMDFLENMLFQNSVNVGDYIKLLVKDSKSPLHLGRVESIEHFLQYGSGKLPTTLINLVREEAGLHKGLDNKRYLEFMEEYKKG